MPLRAYRFSRPAPSATRTPIRHTRRLDAQTPRRPGKARLWKLTRPDLPDYACRREFPRHAFRSPPRLARHLCELLEARRAALAATSGPPARPDAVPRPPPTLRTLVQRVAPRAGLPATGAA